MHTTFTRRIFGGFLLGAIIALGAPVQADDFPNRPITMIIMSSEGGGMDRASRYLGAAMAKELGQPIRYVNRGGASGQIALQSYFAVKNDGYTVFSGNIPTLTLGYGAKKQDYVLEDELAWLGAYLDDPAILATAAGSDYQNANDLINAAKQSPIRVGVANWSSVQTLALLKLAQDTGAQFEIIPFSGFKKAATAMLAQDIEAAVGNFSAVERLGEEARGLGIFAPNAPTDTYIPLADQLNVPIFAASSNRALGVHEALKTSYPDRYKALLTAYQSAVSSPDFKTNISDIRAQESQIISWGEVESEAATTEILGLLAEFRTLFEQGS